MATEDVILVDVMQSIIDAMQVPDVLNPGQFLHMNYEPGRSIQILDSVSALDNSTTLKGLKFPLIAMLMPIREKWGSGLITVTIPRIVIATLSKSVDGTDTVLQKYKSDGNFKTVLYPCYNEFRNRVAWSTDINESDPDALVHQKMDNPGQQQLGQGLSDFIDSIEILDLEITLIQTKNCL